MLPLHKKMSAKKKQNEAKNQRLSRQEQGSQAYPVTRQDEYAARYNQMHDAESSRESAIVPPSPAATDHRAVKISGTCVEQGTAYRGHVTGFVIDTHSAGSGDIGVNIMAPSGESPAADIEAMEHGVSQCSFKPTVTGIHTIMVCFAGMNIHGSPFKVNVQHQRSSSKGDEQSEESKVTRQSVIVRKKTIMPPNSVHASPNPNTPVSELDIKPQCSPPGGLWHRVPRDLKGKLQSCLRKAVALDIGKELGQGEFGKVLEMRFIEEGKGARLVAAKTVKDSDISQDQLEDFLKEAVLMQNFKHNNVLELIGVVVKDTSPYILFEVMKNGNLKEYLIQKEEIHEPDTLIDYGRQVARGMEYVANLKFVHRDLAARNCLVSDTVVIKISDFGLARDNFKQNYVMATKYRQLPLRWMAPEIFQNWTFTSETDVWAYGVLLWEIFTCGGTPYEQIPDQHLVTYLKSGQALVQPPECPAQIYQLMQRCWDLSPQTRPTFTEITHKLSKPIRSNSTELCYKNLNQTSPQTS